MINEPDLFSIRLNGCTIDLNSLITLEENLTIMKTLLYLGIILMFASCSSNESESAASNESSVYVNGREVPSKKIGNLEVMYKDLGRMTWYEGKQAIVDKIGGGWRLPTKKELNILYENKEYNDNFANDGYWSSSENVNYDAWIQDFDSGYQCFRVKKGKYHVRAVRDAPIPIGQRY